MQIYFQVEVYSKVMFCQITDWLDEESNQDMSRRYYLNEENLKTFFCIETTLQQIKL